MLALRDIREWVAGFRYILKTAMCILENWITKRSDPSECTGEKAAAIR